MKGRHHGRHSRLRRSSRKRNPLRCSGCDTIIATEAKKAEQFGRCATCLQEIGKDAIAMGFCDPGGTLA
jgi:hypothetical protein